MGTIVMLAASVVAFRRARATGRNVLLWVSLVWIIGLAVGLIVGSAGACIDVLSAPSMGRVIPFFALWGMAAGNLIGSIAVTVRAGQRQISN